MKKMLFIFVILLFIVPIVFASFIPTKIAKVKDEPAGVASYESSAPTTEWNGETEESKLRVLSRLRDGGLRYPIGEVNLSFRDGSDNARNVSLTNLISEIDITNRKVLYDVSSISAASGTLTMYIEKVPGYNAISICEGATEMSDVGEDVCAAGGGTPKIIFPGGDTKGYTVTTFSDSLTGKEFWKVYGVTGTGLQLFNVLFGGSGGPDFIEQGGSIDLDEEVSKDYVSKENVEYYVIIEGISYLVTVDYVDSESRYASFYVESMDKSFVVYEKDVENFDFNLDGSVDATLVVDNIDYPHVYAELSVFQPTEKFEFAPREKEVVGKRGIFTGRGGIWSRFVEIAEGSWWQVLLMFGLLVLVVVFFGIIGWKLISKMWRAT